VRYQDDGIHLFCSSSIQGGIVVEEKPERSELTSMPAIFHFQPSGYEIVQTPEKLQEWERLMRERVGLSTDGDSQLVASRLPSISYCDYACDCDQV
jgi:hypothetical protein